MLADETTDISEVEQFSLCLHYIDYKCCVREDFIEFVPVYDVTELALASSIKTEIRKFGLDMENLQGRDYDGAASMRGSFRGAQSIILEEYPIAIYMHCLSHCLNLCLNVAVNVSYQCQKLFLNYIFLK